MTDWPRGGLALTIALALSPAAGAHEVTSGVATRLTPMGMEFVAGLASGLTIELPSLPLEFTVEELGCEYDLSIYGYQGEAELGDIHLETVEGSPDHLALSGSVDRFEVGGIIIEATSPDWWCPNYNEEDHDVIVSSLTTDGTSFVLRASGEAVGDALVLDVLTNSTVTLGEVQIVTTQWYLPDDLVEASVASFGEEIEQFILDEAADLLAALLFDLPSAGVLADLGYEARIAEIGIEGDGLTAELDMAAEYVGDIGDCGGGTALLPDDQGQPGDVDGTSGDLQLAIAEEFANAVLAVGWTGGLLCGAFEHLDFSDAAPLFPALRDEDGVRFAYDAVRQPTVWVGTDMLHLDLPEVRLELEDSGGGELLFWADIAVMANVALTLDEDQQTLNISLLWTDMEFLDLDATGLLHGTNYTEAAFLDLIDSQVLLLLPDQLSDMAVAPLNFGFTDLSADTIDGLTESIGVRLIDLELSDGVAHLTVDGLLDVDDEPPWVEILTDTEHPRTATDVAIEYTGEDDRPGELTYSWRVDGGAWSFWSADTSATFVVVEPGLHSFDVRGRDIFWNEGSPASTTFRLELGGLPGGDDEGDGGCECDAAPGLARGPAMAGVAALLCGLLLRRRTTRA